MIIDAVGVTSKDFARTTAFYELLGFSFLEYGPDEQHIESTSSQNSVRLMIDSHDLAVQLLGEEPKPGNHAMFAIRFDSPRDVDEAVRSLQENGFTVKKEPWDAFWGQRYAMVVDPGGYSIDLYAPLD